MKDPIGILTAGGDAPGLNAAVSTFSTLFARAGIPLIGFTDGYEGLAYNRTHLLRPEETDAWLTLGGTCLGTSRNKPHKMPHPDGELRDMIDTIVDVYNKHHLQGLICIGGGGTHKNALRLEEAGLNIITLPKTIDNDIPNTETAIGFDTSLTTCTDELLALETTARSHHRLLLVEMMGHDAGWLALGSALGAGSPFVLLPERPYNPDNLLATLRQYKTKTADWLVLPVAEGALPQKVAAQLKQLIKTRETTTDKKIRATLKLQIDQLRTPAIRPIQELAQQLEPALDWETRVVLPGHLQRAGDPSCADRLLARRLAHAGFQAVLNQSYGYMMSVQGEKIKPVPIEYGAHERKYVTPDHPWLQAADACGIHFGL